MMNNLLVCVFESNENKPCFNPDKPSLFYPFIFLFFFTYQFLFLLQDLKDGFLFRSAWIKTRYVIFNIAISLALKLKKDEIFLLEKKFTFSMIRRSDDLIFPNSFLLNESYIIWT